MSLIEQEKACQLIQNKRIIFFKFNSNRHLPFYWDKAIITSQDIEQLIQEAATDQFYLMP